MAQRNAAIAVVDTDVVLTVDGDTLLEPEATRAMREAFAVQAIFKSPLN
jgi:cellulose synthase/poly-beta-1,6-N-acetylglucosamine synthase-like glycosyltransferase